MSKYAPLWEYVENSREEKLMLTFSQIRDILGFDIDHSFLSYKKELTNYGYSVKKISMKNKNAEFVKENRQ